LSFGWPTPLDFDGELAPAVVVCDSGYAYISPAACSGTFSSTGSSCGGS